MLLYDPAREPENCLKLVLPSQTQIVGGRVREATAAGLPVHLRGELMGGGASSDAMQRPSRGWAGSFRDGGRRSHDPQ